MMMMRRMGLMLSLQASSRYIRLYPHTGAEEVIKVDGETLNQQVFFFSVGRVMGTPTICGVEGASQTRCYRQKTSEKGNVETK
jgi:hypothetical protein